MWINSKNTFLFLTISIFTTNASLKKCLVPGTFEKGHCIPKEDCFDEESLKLRRDTADCYLDYLGNEMVCCKARNCTRPDGTDGICTRIKDCPEIMNIIWNERPITEDRRSYLEKSNCRGEQVPMACCEIALPERCGRIDIYVNNILGGADADIGEHPWTAILQYTKMGELDNKCGGSLISKRYVVTAAHCIEDGYVSSLSVRLGEHNLDQTDFDDDYVPPINFSVEKIIKHSLYNRFSMTNDIALLRLATDVKYSETIGAICLPALEPFPNFAFDDKPISLTAAGWGRTKNATRASIKQIVKFPLIPHANCSRMHQHYYENFSFDVKKICAGEKDKDTCNGDSGGPLMSFVGGYWYLIGLTSYGPEDCGNGEPGVYTSIYHHLLWIRRNMEP